jgi:hypothetical protein
MVAGGVTGLNGRINIHVVGLGQPGQVGAGVIDHTLDDVGAICRVAHQRSFLQHDSGAAKRIQDGLTKNRVRDDLAGWNFADIGQFIFG